MLAKDSQPSGLRHTMPSLGLTDGLGAVVVRRLGRWTGRVRLTRCPQPDPTCPPATAHESSRKPNRPGHRRPRELCGSSYDWPACGRVAQQRVSALPCPGHGLSAGRQGSCPSGLVEACGESLSIHCRKPALSAAISAAPGRSSAWHWVVLIFLEVKDGKPVQLPAQSLKHPRPKVPKPCLFFRFYLTYLNYRTIQHQDSCPVNT